MTAGGGHCSPNRPLFFDQRRQHQQAKREEASLHLSSRGQNKRLKGRGTRRRKGLGHFPSSSLSPATMWRRASLSSAVVAAAMLALCGPAPSTAFSLPHIVLTGRPQASIPPRRGAGEPANVRAVQMARRAQLRGGSAQDEDETDGGDANTGSHSAVLAMWQARVRSAREAGDATDLTRRTLLLQTAASVPVLLAGAQQAGAAESGTVLVLGASGGIGQYVCAELLRRGYKVRGFTRRPAEAQEELKRSSTYELAISESLDSSIEWVRGDLNNKADLTPAIKGVQKV